MGSQHRIANDGVMFQNIVPPVRRQFWVAWYNGHRRGADALARPHHRLGAGPYKKASGSLPE